MASQNVLITSTANSFPLHSNGRHGLPVIKFPAWVYHLTAGSRIVSNQDELDLLGDGWQDTPFPPELAPVVLTKDQIIDNLKAEVDKLVNDNAALREQLGMVPVVEEMEAPPLPEPIRRGPGRPPLRRE